MLDIPYFHWMPGYEARKGEETMLIGRMGSIGGWLNDSTGQRLGHRCEPVDQTQYLV